MTPEESGATKRSMSMPVRVLTVTETGLSIMDTRFGNNFIPLLEGVVKTQGNRIRHFIQTYHPESLQDYNFATDESGNVTEISNG